MGRWKVARALGNHVATKIQSNGTQPYPSFEHGRVILALCQIIDAKVAGVLVFEQSRHLIAIISVSRLHARSRKGHR